MSTSGDNQTNRPAIDFENYVPNVAYTLGDHQPVRSTYIAHDPFFFMDVDDVTLEEELLREFDRDFGAYDFGLHRDDNDTDFLDILMHFDANLDFVCGDEAHVEVNLKNVTEILSKSRYAASLLEFAEVNHIEMIAAPQIKTVEYNRVENIILFQPRLSQTELCKGLLIALRQAWQNYQGAMLQPVALFPDHAVFVNRAQKADIAASLIRTAWELELAGEYGLWADLEKGAYRDLAHAFGREATLDFRSLNSGRAAFMTFETWFLSDRCRDADTGLIQKMLAEYQGHQFEDEDMSQLVMIDLVKAMGEMPYGKNYLAGQIPTLLTDPIFTEVRERSAANFLWFIKFEKTFNEVERSLQKDSALSSSLDDGSTLNSFETYPHENTTGQKGILIPFPREYKRGRAEQAVGNAAQGGEVIPFDIAVRPFNGNFLPS